MKRRRARHGAVLIEFLVAGIITLFVGTALLVLVQSTYGTQTLLIGENMSYAGARKVINTLADDLRNAQPYIPSGQSTPISIAAGTATSVTCYINNASGTPDGSSARYWLDTSGSPSALKLTKTTISPAASTTTTVLSGVQSLQLTYYVSPGGSYTSGGTWSTTSNPFAPSSSELATLGALNIAATISINGCTRRLSTTTRLRNSPYHN